MKYPCETCNGTGMVDDDEGKSVECSICEGEGFVETCISTIKIGVHVRHREGLRALQADAMRVISDCGKMLTCNPPHWKSYVSQLQKTIGEIEKQALELLP